MKKSAFTLVEMLTVIAIIAVLAGITIPAVVMVRGKAKIATASNEVNQIKLALEGYRSNYNQSLPYGMMTANGALLDPDDYASTKSEYTEFMRMLCGEPATGSRFNTRKLALLIKRAKDSDLFAWGDAAAWLDPWEHPYQIVLAAPGNKSVVINSETLYGDIFVYSAGPDGIFNNDDDVLSWKK